MKILHINCSDTGSTGKIINDISRVAAERGYSSVLLCPSITCPEEPFLKKKAVCLRLERGLYRRIVYLTGLQYGLAPISTSKIIRMIKEEKPDVVHLQSPNCNMANLYRVFRFLGKQKIPTVITNHSEYFYTGSCAHAKECERWHTGCGKCPRLFEASGSKLFDRTHTAWERMSKAVSSLDRVVVTSVSPWVHSRSVTSPLLEGIKQVTVENGLNTEIFVKKSTDIRKRLGISDEAKMVLHITALFDVNDTDSKGGRHIVELSERFKGEDVVFVVLGKATDENKMAVTEYSNIKYVGSVADQSLLAEYYSAADVTVIASSRETFSMPVAESLCCGTPIVGFKAGGPESIAMPEYSEFVDQKDLDGLEKILRDRWLEYKRGNDSAAISAAAREVYSGDLMAKKYIEIYEELISQ